MPVCILGMHRSGTSMIARQLNLCGLDLGSEGQMIDPDSGLWGVSKEDNPNGYWENLQFIHLNEEVLEFMGGDSYRNIPDLQPGWANDVRLDPLRHRAKGLRSQFSRLPWGWKDPRNTLTLEFWQSVFPDLKVVLCIRNPLEVVDSILGGRMSSEGEVFDWWLTYHKILLGSLNNSEYIVTNYQSWFYQPENELKRVCEFVGLQPTSVTIEDAVNEIEASLHRNLSTEKLLHRRNIPAQITQHYDAFSLEAGSIYQAMSEDQAYQAQLVEESLYRAHEQFDLRMRRKEDEFRELSGEKESMLGELQSLKENQQNQYEEMEQEFRDHLEALQEHNEAEREKLKADYQAKLDELQKQHELELQAAQEQLNAVRQENEEKLNEIRLKMAETRKTIEDRELEIEVQLGQIRNQRERIQAIQVEYKQYVDEHQQLLANYQQLDKQRSELESANQQLAVEKQQMEQHADNLQAGLDHLRNLSYPTRVYRAVAPRGFRKFLHRLRVGPQA